MRVRKKMLVSAVRTFLSASVVWLLLCLNHAVDLQAEDRSASFVIKEMTFGDEEFDYSPAAMAFSPPEGYLVIGGTARPADRQVKVRDTLWLWKVSLEGEKYGEIDITTTADGPDVKHPVAIHDLEVTQNGGIVLLANYLFPNEQPALMGMDKTGRVLFLTQLVPSAPAAGLFNMFRADPRHFFLIGDDPKAALVVKVDETGHTVWERRVEHEGQQNIFLDGIATQEGGALLVGASIPPSKEGEGWQISVWLVKVDADGNIQSEQPLPGRHARIAPAADGGIVIVSDEGQRQMRDAWLQKLGPDLKTVWRTHLFSEVGLTAVLALPANDGGFFLTATRKGAGLWIAKVDREGKQIDEYFRPQAGLLHRNGVLTVKDTAFLLTEFPSDNAKKQPAAKVEITRVTTK